MSQEKEKAAQANDYEYTILIFIDAVAAEP